MRAAVGGGEEQGADGPALDAFLELAELSEGERARVLAAMEPGLRERVECLIAADAVEDDWLQPSSRQLSEPSSGDRLGDYELLEEIGRGGMGIVFRARQLSLDRTVAVKVLGPSLHLSADEVERLRREGRGMARVDHPGVVRVLQFGNVEGVAFLAMEFVAGGSLRDQLGALLEGGAGAEPLRPGLCARRALEIAQALAALHEAGILHLDIKPSNILLGPGGSPRLVDFGLVREVAHEPAAGPFLCTPEYTAPELLGESLATPDARCDVYAVGAVLYELLTLRRPSRAAGEPIPPSRTVRRVPRDLEAICLKALREEPDERYASARALAEDLQRFLAHEAIQARLPSSGERLRRWLSRHRRGALTVACVGAAAVLGAVWSSSLQLEDSRRDAQQRVDAMEAGQLQSEGDFGAQMAAVGLASETRELLTTGSEDNRESWARLNESIDAWSAQRLAAASELLAGVEEALPWERSYLLARGLEEVFRAQLLAGPERLLDRAEASFWFPRLTVNGPSIEGPGEAEWEVYVRSLDPIEGVVGEPRFVAAMPCAGVPLKPGYYRIALLRAGELVAECVREVYQWNAEVVVSLRPAASSGAEGDMVLVPGGAFDFGSGEIAGSPSRARRREVEPFWIDRTEVSNAEYHRFVLATGRPAPVQWSGWADGFDPSTDRRPATGVAFEDARAYAEWVGKRLPTIWEWERAFRGIAGRRFPSESEGQEAAVLGHRSALADPSRAHADHWRGYREHVRPVDDPRAWATPDGLLHGLGNVEEWTSTFAWSVRRGAWRPELGSHWIKGGSWATPRAVGTLDAVRHAFRDVADVTIGFRCVRSADYPFPQPEER